MSARLVGLALLVGLLVGPQRVDARKKRTDAAADAPPAATAVPRGAERPGGEALQVKLVPTAQRIGALLQVPQAYRARLALCHAGL